jgi:DnaJ-class molecular chaperone
MCKGARFVVTGVGPRPCPNCKSTGTVPSAPEKCPTCGGSGKVERKGALGTLKELWDGKVVENCPKCKGSGIYHRPY